MSDEPRPGTDGVGRLTPMSGLGGGLAVEFKDEFGMTGPQQRRGDGLMATGAGVGADVEILEVAHPGVGAVGGRPIGAGVGAQPVLGRSVAAFAGDAFAGFEVFSTLRHGHGVEGRMAGDALRVGGGVLHTECGGYLPGARGGEGGGGALGMGVLERPDEELVLLVAPAAVAAGGAARGGTEEVRGRGGR